MAYLLGIDIGTSGTKVVLFDHEGRTVASALSEYPLYQPQIGWAEQEPADWWNAVQYACRETVHKAQIDPADVDGIGLSGQMHGLVMLDGEDRPLRRSIIWCDQRTGAECDDMTEIIGRERLIEITANPALTGFTASKILWVKKHEPEIFEKCRKIMLPKDYVRYMMTGEFATEVSDASGMQLLDVPKRQWSDEVLDKLGIDKALLGRVYESCEVTGRLTPKAAELCGLVPGIPVVGGAGDQAAAAVGNGIVRPGLVSSTLGTSGVVFAHTDRIAIDPRGRVHTLCHAVPGAWHIMGVTQGAGLSLKWFRDNFCLAEVETAAAMDIDPYVLMDKQAARVPVGSNGVLYLPYLMGERTPHLDANAKGVFFGLSAIHTKSDMLRAVMEGVTFSLLDCLNIIREMGVEPTAVRASGGGGRSPLWRQMQADVFGTEVRTVNSTEGGALGVAILAGVGAGVYDSVEKACESIIGDRTSQQPDLEAHKKYEGFYEIYRRLYPCLRDQYEALARLL